MVEDIKRGDSDSKPIRILHVEDEKGALEITKLFLKRKGYDNFKITQVLSAEQALEKLEYEPFDVILSDYKMPGMNGLEFLEELRNKGNEVPFIIFTGKGEEKVAMEALNKGANRYIKKDGNPAVLFDTLGQHILEVVAERTKHKDINISQFMSQILEQDEKIKKLMKSNRKLSEALEYLYSSPRTMLTPEELRRMPQLQESEIYAYLKEHLDIIILGLLADPMGENDYGYNYKSMSEREIVKEIHRKFDVRVEPEMLRIPLDELKRKGIITDISGKLAITPFHLR
ncbi:MAG: response regulator [Halobacteriota archaeon]